MENEPNELFETMLNIAILLIAAGITVTLFSSAKKYDHTVSDLSMHKASSYYTLAYGEEEYYITGANVVSDIQNSNGTIDFMINGQVLSDSIADKIKNRNAAAVTDLINRLGDSQYKKVTIYDNGGNVTALNFEGGH